MNMETPHKNAPHVHAEVIKAWADGAEIEYFEFDAWWYTTFPTWDVDKKYRIKPSVAEPHKPKPDYVEYFLATFTDVLLSHKRNEHNLKLTFDGETGKLKSAEVL